MPTVNTKEKPCVLWLTSSYPRYTGDSASIFLKNLAESIDAENFNLHILAPDDALVEQSIIPGPSVVIHHFQYFFPKRLQLLAYGSGILPNLKAQPMLFFQVPCFLISQFLI